ncbi:tripartite motif-containing protein 75-like [Dreissena polymorpha]|nr:tripartite motif-containing protein 75-like [Dreissena polymorpha]
MASNLKTSQQKGSDVFYEVCCSVCDEDGINNEGLFHCKICLKTYCDDCVKMHKKLLKDHAVSAKSDGDSWYVANKVDDTIELCEEHTTEKLTMFCEDHEQLLCNLCLLLNHRQCSRVFTLAEQAKSNSQRIPLVQVSKGIEKSQKRLKDMVDRGKDNIKSLKASYEQICEEILDERRQINENLDRLQQNTIRELESIYERLNNSIEDDTKRCLECISKLKIYGAKLKDNILPERTFMTLRKCIDQTTAADSLLKSMIKNDGTDIKFQPNRELIQCHADCTDLGKIIIGDPQHNVDPNKIVSIEDKSEYNVQTATDKYPCAITGICTTSNGDLVIADYYNHCVKLLNQAYKVIDQVQLPTTPRSMCSISSFEMAVTVSKRKGIYFLRVDGGKIIREQVLKMNHDCHGIAHVDAEVFVTSVAGVWVSPDGKMIYVTGINGMLRTLTRDGTVTATFQDPAFKYGMITAYIHVAARGQVFVCGDNSISQVDTVGKTILNTISVDIAKPASVYFNEETRKLIVGFWSHDNINEFKTKTVPTF